MGNPSNKTLREKNRIQNSMIPGLQNTWKTVSILTRQVHPGAFLPGIRSQDRCQNQEHSFQAQTLGLAPTAWGGATNSPATGPTVCVLALNFFPLLSILMRSSSHTSNTGNSIYGKIVRPRDDYTTSGGWRPDWCPQSPSPKGSLKNVPEGKGCGRGLAQDNSEDPTSLG